MWTSATRLLADKKAFWSGPRTRAALGRLSEVEDVYETKWQPDWKSVLTEEFIPASRTRRGGLSVTTRGATPTSYDATEAAPQVNVFWENQRSLPSGLIKAIQRSTFHTSCGPALSQHVWYVVDNQLFVVSYLSLAYPAYFDDVENRQRGQIKPLLTLDSTITDAIFFTPRPNVLPNDPRVAIAVVTASQVWLFALYEDGINSDYDEEFKIRLLIGVPDIESALNCSFCPPLRIETTDLWLRSLPEFVCQTGDRKVTQLKADGKTGRIFLVFEDDGAGLYELVYRRVKPNQKRFFPFKQSPIDLVRLILPSGDPCRNNASYGPESPTVKRLAKAVKDVITDASVKMSKWMAFGEGQENSSAYSFGNVLQNLHVGSPDGLIVTVDTAQVIRIYACREETDDNTRKRKRVEERSFGGASNNNEGSPARRRRLDSPSGESEWISGQNILSNGANISGPLTSSSGALELVSSFSLDFLASEFFKCDHFDAKFLSAQGLGRISDSALSRAIADGVYVLTLITSAARKIEISLDLSIPNRFEFSLLGIERIDFTSGASSSFWEESSAFQPALDLLPPSPAAATARASLYSSRGDYSADSFTGSSPGCLGLGDYLTGREFTKCWKYGPVFVCAFSRILNDNVTTTVTGPPPESSRSHPIVCPPYPTINGRPFSESNELGPANSSVVVSQSKSSIINLITVGLHPSIAPLNIPRADFSDAFLCIETEQPIRMVVDANHAWLSSLDLEEEKKHQELLDGFDLLTIAVQNTLLQSHRRDQLLRDNCRRAIESGQNYNSRSAPMNPFSKTFWVFFDTYYRKLHIRWTCLQRLPGQLSVSLNIASNLEELLATGDLSKIPPMARVALHPDNASLCSPSAHVRRSNICGATASLLPALAVEGVSDTVCRLFWDILDEPLLRIVSVTNQLVRVKTWSRLVEIRQVCSSMLKLLGSQTSREFLPDGVLSTSNPAGQASTRNFILPQNGKGELENVFLNISRKSLIFLNQYAQLGSIAAFLNLMYQIGTLLMVTQLLEQSFYSNVNGSPEIWVRLFGIMQSKESDIETLAQVPLKSITASEWSIKPFRTLTQAVLELMISLGEQTDLISDNEKALLDKLTSTIYRECGWLIANDSPVDILRMKLRKTAEIKDKSVQELVIVQTILNNIPAVSGTRQKNRYIELGLSALLNTGHQDVIPRLVAHLISEDSKDALLIRTGYELFIRSMFNKHIHQNGIDDLESTVQAMLMPLVEKRGQFLLEDTFRKSLSLRHQENNEQLNNDLNTLDRILSHSEMSMILVLQSTFRVLLELFEADLRIPSISSNLERTEFDNESDSKRLISDSYPVPLEYWLVQFATSTILHIVNRKSVKTLEPLRFARLISTLIDQLGILEKGLEESIVFLDANTSNGTSYQILLAFSILVKAVAQDFSASIAVQLSMVVVFIGIKSLVNISSACLYALSSRLLEVSNTLNNDKASLDADNRNNIIVQQLISLWLRGPVPLNIESLGSFFQEIKFSYTVLGKPLSMWMEQTLSRLRLLNPNNIEDDQILPSIPRCTNWIARFAPGCDPINDLVTLSVEENQTVANAHAQLTREDSSVTAQMSGQYLEAYIKEQLAGITSQGDIKGIISRLSTVRRILNVSACHMTYGQLLNVCEMLGAVHLIPSYVAASWQRQVGETMESYMALAFVAEWCKATALSVVSVPNIVLAACGWNHALDADSVYGSIVRREGRWAAGLQHALGQLTQKKLINALNANRPLVVVAIRVMLCCWLVQEHRLDLVLERESKEKFKEKIDQCVKNCGWFLDPWVKVLGLNGYSELVLSPPMGVDGENIKYRAAHLEITLVNGIGRLDCEGLYDKLSSEAWERVIDQYSCR